MERRHSITLNGEAATTSAASLAELLDERGLAGARVATALNGYFVPAPARAATAIGPGDRVEIVSAREGG